MKTSARIIYWLPRIICICAIALVSMFAFDSFAPGNTFMQNAGALIMHLIPSFLLVAFLIFAWKWEMIGGIIFVLLGAGLSPFLFMHNYRMNNSVGATMGILLLITFPFILVGILFIISHVMRKKRIDQAS